MCDKLGGEKGKAFRTWLELIVAQGNKDGAAGIFIAKLNGEMSDEEFITKLKSSGGTLRHLEEWAKLPPVETWDQRN